MWNQYDFSENEVCLQKTSLNFVDSVWEIFGPILKGIPLVISSDEAKKDPKLLLDTVKKNKITRLVIVPSLLKLFVKIYFNELKELIHLKILTVSGEVLQNEIVNKFKKCLPNTCLLNLYGSTEVSGDVTFHQVFSETLKSEYSLIGKPISNNKIFILNDDFQLLPIGYCGNICISGRHLSHGYLNNEELTNEYFKKVKIFNDEYEIYITGDKGRLLDDGNIEFMGRVDSQVKINGIRIEIGEIEACLSSLDTIQDSNVIVIESSSGTFRLEAFLVLSKKTNDSDENQTSYFISKLSKKLPSFMIPERFHFIDKIPLTPNGKIDKLVLKHISYQQENSHLKGDSFKNLNKLDKIWLNYLGIKSFDRKSNPINYGANSLMLIEVKNEIRKEFNVELSFTELTSSFENQNNIINNKEKIMNISYNIDNDIDTNASVYEEQMYFLEENLVLKGTYNLLYKCNFNTRLNIEVLEKSLNLLANKNPILLSNFYYQLNSKKLKKFIQKRSLSLQILSNYENENLLMNELLTYCFDLTKGDLMIIRLLETKSKKHVMLVCAHHIIMDGISFQNFFIDLSINSLASLSMLSSSSTLAFPESNCC